MTAQMLPNLVYAALLLAVLLMPYLAYFRGEAGVPSERLSVAERLAMLLVSAVAILLTWVRQGDVMPLSLILLVPLIGHGPRALLGGLVAVLLFAPVTWWAPGPGMTWPLVGLFLLLGLGAAALPRLWPSASGAARPAALALLMLACLIIGLIAGLLTAPFGSQEPIYLAWHHWGAYLAPVEAWLAGGLPYRDFPIQYGLGPTALLAATCGSDCWRGMFAVTVGANALYFATLAGCVLILTAALARGVRWLGLLALFCACFIWTAFPLNLAGPAMTPSVAGLRFLPVSALLLHILIAEDRDCRRDWIGHLLWAIDLLWSPEAAYFGTLIWWPYLARRDAGGAGPRDAARALARGALRGAGALLLGLAALALIVWLLAGRAIGFGDFLAYIQHPPGPLPANPLGTIWLGLASILLAALALLRERSPRSRSLYACLLGLLGAGSYYLSRSHDNNVLNLFPLLVPVLLAAMGPSDAARPALFAAAFGRTVLSAMVAFVVTVNAYPWVEAATRGRLLELGPARLIARFSPTAADEPAILSRDAVAGLTYLRGRGAGAVVLLDDGYVIPWAPAGEGWTGVNNAANFEPLPEAMIARYVERGAAAYRRPGWLLVDESRYGRWRAMFETAYAVRERHRFGTYAAYYMVPR